MATIDRMGAAFPMPQKDIRIVKGAGKMAKTT
jgi:hypothetical protein